MGRAPSSSRTGVPKTIHATSLNRRLAGDFNMGCRYLDELLLFLTNHTLQRVNGWRTAKRPGVDYFLAYLSQFYEIVIFTSQHHYVRCTFNCFLIQWLICVLRLPFRFWRNSIRTTSSSPTSCLGSRPNLSADRLRRQTTIGLMSA